MNHQDVQRSYDNEEPEDYEVKSEKCPCCGQRKCVETQIMEREELDE